jgi:hypothetical protein
VLKQVVGITNTAAGNEEHSRNIIDANHTILVKRQMIVYQEVELEPGFELDIEGELVVLD